MQTTSTEPTVNEQVITLLTNAGIKFNITAKGTGLKRDNWECDGWMLELSRKGKSEYFDYFTGIGHRTPIPKPTHGPMPRKGTLMYEQLENQRKPVTPEVCGIIHSLNLDSQAIDESFPNWCDNYEYDSDSIKALNVYNACCDNAKKYYSVVDRATRDQLEVILADY